jgi:hypothetical protein
LSEEQKRIVHKFVLEGRLNGLDLKPAEQQNFIQVLSNIGQERAKYRGKLEVRTILQESGVILVSPYLNYI